MTDGRKAGEVDRRRGPTMRGARWLVPLLLLASPLAAQQAEAAPDTVPKVRGVLFFLPTCPHCRQVMTEDLPPLMERYGEALRIVAVNTSSVEGRALYLAAVRGLAIPDDRIGVPTLVVGSRVLVGSREIPEELPGLVERGLAAGGVDWPDVPLMREALAGRDRVGDPHPGVDEPAEPPAAAPEGPPSAAPTEPDGTVPVATTSDEARRLPSESAVSAPSDAAPVVASDSVAAASSTPAEVDADSSGIATLGPHDATGSLLSLSMADRFLLDPVGNSASVAALLLMVVALVVGVGGLTRWRRPPPVPSWVVPALAVVGLGVAAYLAFVEVTGSEAVCGPVGDCNTVQQSEYARLFGILPVGLLGVGGYLALLLVWTAGVVGPMGIRRVASAAVWGMALLATLFSLYLTFLEPFVIGATCAWCLSSALVAALILLAATRAAAPRSEAPPAT